MKQNKASYDLILFLYGYLRQVDLSLDRSRWGMWSKVRDYYKNRIEPNKIIEYLKRRFILPETDLSHFIFSIKEKMAIEKLLDTILQNQDLLEGEILYCCKLLWKFDEQLKSSTEWYSLEIEETRVAIAEFYTTVLAPKISNADLNKLMRIEHFEQNDNIETVKLDQYIPGDL